MRKSEGDRDDRIRSDLRGSGPDSVTKRSKRGNWTLRGQLPHASLQAVACARLSFKTFLPLRCLAKLGELQTSPSLNLLLSFFFFVEFAIRY